MPIATSSDLRSAYDVVIAGSPGGTALATFLARAGHGCLVFDGAKFLRCHIRESLIPHASAAFEPPGLLPKLRAFSFPKFAARFPEQRPALIGCLVGDGLKDRTPFKAALAQMSAPPPPLAA
jgi:2-polyprenyl-6-methoxyphenol hydroxylase-like FAD-dependent oxidoreductase